ncbi:hypothetical protein EC973_006975 [Apophysomyces ossiformis]|uniref:Uncharacterized protein n=1 Tax=Apophysomyces ossiformis TaxID=679940 RepID=A0A8H7EUE7_9FUNG|nr:hypothetical protein EC973_006975 [Apophysomyces ossiformis]
MKWSSITLTAAATFCLATAAQAGELIEDFRTPKNIMFAGLMGGSSHINWVLNIVDELAERGHNVTYLTRDDHARFGKPYPRIKTLSIGPQAKHLSKVAKKISTMSMMQMVKVMMNAMTVNYVEEYHAYIEAYKKNNIDLVICDHFLVACIDAATNANIPFIVSMSMPLAKDASSPYTNDEIFTRFHPTTLEESFATRFYNRIISPFHMMWNANTELKGLAKVRESMGVKNAKGPLDAAWGDSVKIVNTVFGLEPARPRGPLVELVGPIIPRGYTPLTEELQQFLDSHQRVAYIAFGQHAAATTDSLVKIMIALLENIEKGHLDGFMWATVSSTENFPETVTTSSKKTYKVADMFNNVDPHARMVKWAPQYAVLHHPSTVMFVSHGGAGSLHEALFAGKRLAIFPFFGDQPGSAWNVEHNGLGRKFNRFTPQHEMIKVIEDVALDKDGRYQANVERYKALVQIHSRHGVMRGADTVEEITFMHQNGKIPHRYEVARQMSYIKAHNLDLYAVALVILISPFIALYKLTPTIAKKIHLTNKMKKL